MTSHRRAVEKLLPVDRLEWAWRVVGTQIRGPKGFVADLEPVPISDRLAKPIAMAIILGVSLLLWAAIGWALS